MKVLVTGGTGFVGCHLVKSLISKGHFPIIIDNLSTGNYRKIKKFVDSKKAQFFVADIRNLKNLLNLPQPDSVIHLAAIASVVESIKNPRLVNDVNVTGTLNLLEFCRVKKIPQIIFISSAAVFGDYRKEISEDSPTNPTSVYGATKLFGEQYCRIYSSMFGLKSIILRLFNVYGPGQNEEYAGVISKFIERISKNKSPIIFGKGTQTRDFIYVDDVVDACTQALSYSPKNNLEIFNVASGKSISVNNLANRCLKILNKKSLSPIHKKGEIGVPNSSANIRKASKMLGFFPKTKLNDGLKTLFTK